MTLGNDLKTLGNALLFGGTTLVFGGYFFFIALGCYIGFCIACNTSGLHHESTMVLLPMEHFAATVGISVISCGKPGRKDNRVYQY